MPIFPLRRLGDVGIVTDISPYDLPPNALSQGNNLRFTNGKITRAPGFKTILATTASFPVFAFNFSVPGETDAIGIANADGSLYFYKGTTETDVTPGSFTPVTNTEPHTSCMLSNVVYVNRNSAAPMYYKTGSVDFDELPNWPANYTCKSLRAFKSFLVAINITKAGTPNATMVKWSDITTINTYPGSWDETDPTKSAGENSLDEVTSELIDGMALRDAFILYTETQAHLMEYTNDQDVFRFRKLFDNAGVINANCAVEIEGKHYVFGSNDIYVHDGVSIRSLIRGSNYDYVFNNMVRDSKSTFFATYDPQLTEVMFCYVSADSQCNFLECTYPNKAAVYNITNNTWAFRDLPNSGGATIAALSNSMTYASSTPLTYATVGGSYADSSSSSNKSLFFVSAINTGAGITASRLVGYDRLYGGSISQEVNTELTKEAYAERIGVDMDEIGEQVRAYKVLNTLYPQGDAYGGTNNMGFSFAATEYADMYPSWSSVAYFNPVTAHKVNSRASGRYLAWKLTNSSSSSDHSLSGFDAEITTTGRR